jgi:hypothetical protein
MWGSIDSLNSSFSSQSSSYDYDSISPLYGSQSRNNNNPTTTDDSSMIYNPNHQTIKQEEHSIKRELSSPLNGTPPQKTKLRNDGTSVLPTPPPSSDFSAASLKMMVRNLNIL